MPTLPKVVMLLEETRGAGRMLMQGITEYARIHGPWVFHTQPPYYVKPSGKKKMAEWIKELGIQGIIMRDSDIFEGIDNLDIPIVVSHVIEKSLTEYPIISSGSNEIGKMAAEYFLNRGFTHFAYFGFKGMVWSQARGEAFSKTLKKAGYDTYFYPNLRSKKRRFWGSEHSAIANWLQSLPKPLCVLTCCDDLGHQILDACRGDKILVPEEVAVLGIDNDELVCNMTYPPMSSILLNFKRAGYEAAKILDDLMAGKKPEKPSVDIQPLRVVTRRSTDITAIQDSNVAEAVNFIHKHVRLPIQVDDVAEASCISRRTLYEKFQNTLNRSVHDEVKRVRTGEIARLLTETDLSIEKIAAIMNFSTSKHISRYFSKNMGMTPFEYRQKHGRF